MKTGAYAVYVAAIAALFATGTLTRASEDDARIVTSFEESFVYRTHLTDDSIKTRASDGVVTLTGSVADDAHRKLALDAAESLPGVVRVDNQLQTVGEIEMEKSDTWIARKVKWALLFHRNVNGRGTTVTVENGIVTLTGEADSEAQRALTTEYAQDIKGVTEVINEMTVAAAAVAPERTETEKVDDASVTAQVKAVLDTHASTHSADVAVSARDGHVTVTGIAENTAERALVTKLISGVHSVEGVDNEMTLATVASE